MSNVISAIVNGAALQVIMDASFNEAIANESRYLAFKNGIIGVLLIFFVVSGYTRANGNAFFVFKLIANFDAFGGCFFNCTYV